MRRAFLTRRFLVLSILAAYVSGCATASDAGYMPPREAIWRAAEAAPAEVHGIFVMDVQRTGRAEGRVFLNSELDYRDQRNLSVSISGSAAAALTEHYGTPPDVYFLGKPIRITGGARRVRIDFRTSSGPTGLYYYQTHVQVEDPDQISVRGR